MRPTLIVLTALSLAATSIEAETLLVVRKTDNAMDFVDPGSGLQLASVALGHAPHEVSVSPDGKFAAVSNYGTSDRPGSTVSIVDLERPGETRRIDLSPHTRPHGVDWYREDRLAVTAEGSQSLLIVDPRAGKVVTSVNTDQEISHMVSVTPDGRRAFVTNIGSGSTTAIDLKQGSPLGQLATGEGSEGLALTLNGGELWVGARAAGALAVVDTASLQIVERLALPGVPIRLAATPDGRAVLVTCAGSSEIVAFDAVTRKEKARRKIDVPLADGATERPFARLAPGSALPVGVTLSRDGRSVFVAATMADKVVELDASTLTPRRVIDVGGEPDGMATTHVLQQSECHGCSSRP